MKHPENEAAYRELLDLMPEAVVIHADGRMVYVNREAVRLLAAEDSSDLVGRSVFDFLEPEFVSVARGRIEEVLTEKGIAPPIEEKIRRLDGMMIDVEISASAVSFDHEPAVQAVVRDLTERKRAREKELVYERGIIRSEQELRATFDAIRFPVLVLDREARIRRMNRSARDLLASLEPGVMFESLREIEVEPWRTSVEIADRVLREATGGRAEVIDEESGKTWSVGGSLMVNEPGDERVILIAQDVSDDVELRRSLRENEILAVLGGLVGGVAHEVRNPLFAILTGLEVMERRFASLPELTPYISNLRRDARRIQRLMDDLLEYGRPGGLDIAPEHVESLLREAVSVTISVADAARVGIRFRTAEPLPPLHCDRDRIVQALSNLIQNAVQHASAQSIVEIEARSSGGQIEIVVQDRGPGIPPEHMPRLFEPFFSRRSGGTGLGLFIVRRVVEQHHGRVWAENRSGGGARLAVSLPPGPPSAAEVVDHRPG